VKIEEKNREKFSHRKRSEKKKADKIVANQERKKRQY
jgi:hypothetical protein